MTSTNIKIIDTLTNIARSHKNDHNDSFYKVLIVQPNGYNMEFPELETEFDLKYYIVDTEAQGCCYVDNANGGDPIISIKGLRGVNLLDSPSGNKFINIAYLDSLFSTIICKPDLEKVITGKPTEKASLRARIVCDEVRKLAKELSPKNGKKITILNVGVVGAFIKNLIDGDAYIIKACDLHSGIAGKRVNGIIVENATNRKKGDNTLELIKSADVALVTGMTLATDTLDDIISTALEHKTKLVIFAETGANFAEEYCKLGADVVISEPFPFYMITHGNTTIKIYRRN